MSCNKNSGPLPTYQLVGLNDSAIYHLGKDGHTVAAEKKEYFKPSEFLLYFNRDTIELGEEFHAFFYVYKKDFEIEIEQPLIENIKKTNEKEPERGVEHTFTYKSDKPGIFNFKAKIKYDSIVSPVEWRVIVVEEK